MEMNIVPVEIDESLDNRIYTQIAYLLDGTEIITEIIETRNQFHIAKPFPPGDYEAWNDHILRLAGFDPKEYREMDKIPSNERKVKWLKEKSGKMNQRLSWLHFFNMAIAKTRRMYHFPALFEQVITQAILFNKVSTFQTAYPRITYEPEYNPVKIPDEDVDAVLSVVVSPYSTHEDVLEALAVCQKGNLREVYERTNPSEPKLDADTRSNIKVYRKWFWMNYKTSSNRLGYKKIEKLTGANLETIKSGIKSYASFVNSR